MEVLVARIPEEGSQFVGSDPGSILGLENEPFIKEAGDVRFELYAQHVSDELVVSGTLSACFDLKCTRCSEFFSTTVTDSDFLRAYPASMDTDSVDITLDMREDLLLHMPRFPVCGGECKGLCAQCGVNLNEGSCGCKVKERPNQWSALDNLDL